MCHCNIDGIALLLSRARLLNWHLFLSKEDISSLLCEHRQSHDLHLTRLLRHFERLVALTIELINLLLGLVLPCLGPQVDKEVNQLSEGWLDGLMVAFLFSDDSICGKIDADVLDLVHWVQESHQWHSL